jgi:uncharacterized protein (TIGR02611 family)
MPTGPTSPDTEAQDTDPAGEDRPGPTAARPAGHPAEPADTDRWAWRARIRRNPATRGPYRLAVGVVGALLLVLAAVTGPLPGPGGIPLALLALAVLATEFEWAARLLNRVRRELVRASNWARRQPGWVQRLGAVVTVGVVVAGFYLYLLVLGVPTWLPTDVRAPLLSVPGLT